MRIRPLEKFRERAPLLPARHFGEFARERKLRSFFSLFFFSFFYNSRYKLSNSLCANSRRSRERARARTNSPLRLSPPFPLLLSLYLSALQDGTTEGGISSRMENRVERKQQISPSASANETVGTREREISFAAGDEL